MIRAIHFADKSEHRRAKLPGSVHFTEAGDDGVSALWFYCPSGCGRLVRITVGVGFKPHQEGPSWNWNGSTTEPTLHPSVNRIDANWHGWLRNGYWESC